MKQIGHFFSWIFISAALFWFAAMVFSNDTCTRVYRSSWPVVYAFKGVEALTWNWVDDEAKLSQLKWKAKTAHFVQGVFEKTVYGSYACSK